MAMLLPSLARSIATVEGALCGPTEPAEPSSSSSTDCSTTTAHSGAANSRVAAGAPVRPKTIVSVSVRNVPAVGLELALRFYE